MAAEDGKRNVILPIAVTVVGLAAIGVAENIHTRHSVEHNLTTRSSDALHSAGLPYSDVSFVGRDGTVEILSASDRDRALAIVRNVNGVRVVRVIVATANSAGSPPVTASPTPSVTLTIEPSPSPSPSAPGTVPSASASAPPSASASATGTPSAPPSPSPSATTPPTGAAPPAGTLADVQKQLSALGDVTFPFGSAKLTSRDNTILRKIAAILQANPDLKIRVQGDTDSSGPAAFNLQVSRMRATTVANALAALGVASDRMTIVAYGETHPLVPNTTAHNRALNRRVDFQATD